jgi:hypothetical protein
VNLHIGLANLELIELYAGEQPSIYSVFIRKQLTVEPKRARKLSLLAKIEFFEYKKKLPLYKFN